MIRRESRRHVREERTDRRCMKKQKAKQICKSKYKFCIARRAESRRLSACGIDGKFPGKKCDLYIININLYSYYSYYSSNVFLDLEILMGYFKKC